jgi:hypothetical protein
MTAKANDTPLGVNAVHAEWPERHGFDNGKESCLLCRRHNLTFEQETIGRTFQWKELLLVYWLSKHSES